MKKTVSIYVCLSIILYLAIIPVNSKAESITSITTKADVRRTDNLTAYIDQMIKEKNISGSLLVAHHGEILFDRGFGISDSMTQEENTPKTKFLIGSVTKSFTAMAIMQLYEKQLLDIHDTIDKYIPDFPHSNEITIFHLLTHTSGLPSDISDIAKIDRLPSNMDEALSIVRGTNIPLLSRPGTFFHYSNTGYVLLGFIIEKITGISYGEYVQQKIFNPLEMYDSGFGYDRNKVENLAVSYDAKGHPLISEAYMDMSVWPQAAGGLYSTAEDLYKWDRALYGDLLVGKDFIDAVFTPYIGDNLGSGYGYGWGIYHTGKGIEDIEDRICIMHGGLYSGFGCSILRFIEDDTCIISLNNKNDTALSDKINMEITRILFKPEVSIQGNWVNYKNNLIFDQNTLLFPADELAESLNSTYKWDTDSNKITISREEMVIEMQIDSPYATVYQQHIEHPTATLINNVPFAPAEYICKNLGFQYEYDERNCVVVIYKAVQP